MEDLQNGLKKMKTKDKLGHDVINGHTIHEFKDYLCIVCFEYEIKEQERENFKDKIQDRINELKKLITVNKLFTEVNIIRGLIIKELEELKQKLEEK